MVVRAEVTRTVIRLDVGDDRPGRPTPRERALVVESDPGRRLQLRNRLAAVGYDVTTCPGPAGGAQCPALAGEEHRCPRIQAGTALVVLDDDLAHTPVRDAYDECLPLATVRVTSRLAVRPT